MKSTHVLKLSSLVLAMGLSLSAQAQQTLPEPLLQAARKAVLTHPEVQASWHGFQAADVERDVARSGYFPKIDLNASLGRESRESPAVGDAGRYSFNTAQLTLDQMLFDGLLTRSEVRRLGYAKLTRYYELQDISESAALAALRAYADVARSRELVEVAKDNYREHKQTTVQMEERARSGVGRGADLEQANGRLALAETAILTELTKLHDASARYLHIVGEKPPANLAPLPEPFKLGPLPASAEILLSEGLRGSPSLNAAAENTRAYAQAVASRKAAFMPELNARAYIDRERNTGGYRGNTRVDGIELKGSYNVYRGGSDQARTNQAVDQGQQARELQEKTCRDVRQTLSIAYSNVRRLNEQLVYLDQHRLTTEKSREAYRQQFNIGQRTLLDLLDTQKEYFEATRAYINARYDQATAQATTLSGMGRLVAVLGALRSDVPSAQDAGQDRDELSAQELCPTDFPDDLKVVKDLPKRGTGSYVVLLPSPDGSVGRVVVQGQKGEQTLAQAQQSAPLDGSSTPSAVSDEQLRKDFGAAMTARPPLPEHFVLYFKSGTDQLTTESQATLPKVLERLRARKVPDISVVGHTDTLRSDAVNEALGLKRANAVVKQIRTLGIGNLVLNVESHGERDLLVPTPDETPEPRNRRVEITVR